jgi:hypothetical protein
MEGRASLRFGVEKSKIKWGAYLQDAIRFRDSASGQFPDYLGRDPSVVVHNHRGETRITEVTKSMKGARDRAAALEMEYHALDSAQCCAAVRRTDLLRIRMKLHHWLGQSLRFDSISQTGMERRRPTRSGRRGWSAGLS